MNVIRPGMGTENASILLAAIVRMYRPSVVLEIGAGDSTIALAQGLQNAVADWERDRAALRDPEWCERVALLDPVGVPETYDPKLITVDDFSGEGSSAEAAWARLRASGVRLNTVQFVQQDFFSIPERVRDEWGQIDIAWIDAGTPADDVRFVAELWDRIRPGGFLVVHEPTMLSTVERAGDVRLETTRNPMWEELTARVNDDYELVTLPEPHKYRQSGMGLIRKRRAEERSVRRESLQRELMTLGEPPIRNDYIQAGLGPDLDVDRLRVLRDPDVRRVHAAVTLGSGTLTAVSDATGLPVKLTGKTISRLLSTGLIVSHDGILRAEDEPWRCVGTQPRRATTNLTDTMLEDQEVLERIASLFAPGQQYAEVVVSSMCAMFTDDFARLRRKLIDDGYLTRIENVYQRAELQGQVLSE